MESGRVQDEIPPVATETTGTETTTTTTTEEARFQQNMQGAPVVMMQQQKKRSSSSTTVACELVQVILRGMVATCMLGSFVIMLLFTQQTYSLQGAFTITATYRSSPSLEFFVIACAVAGLYSILSLCFVYCCPRSRFLHALDMMVLAISVAAFSAACAVGYIGLHGNNTAGWSKICSYVKVFCGHSIISLGFAFIGFLLHFSVCILSSL